MDRYSNVSKILKRYDDNRRDLGGEVAKQVAASVPGDTVTPPH